CLPLFPEAVGQVWYCPRTQRLGMPRRQTCPL
ncbi:hypothetical protein BBBGCB_BBBGCB_10555, partial [Dysosmobacter welbionis]